jgi:tetratricopeptide (TPR) repeat protein
MVFCRKGFLAACGLLVLPLSLWAATEEEAARLAREGRLVEAAAAYRSVVAQNPKTARLRIELADVLARDRLWNEAVAEYATALKLSPGNAEALLGIGTVRRWQGHIGESAQAFEKARAAAPQNSAATLGLAATYALDHDFARAQRLYDEAAGKWPKDDAVRQERYDFARQVNPRAYLYFENGLSFQTRIGGVAAPFGSREEIAYEHQQELRYLSSTGEHTYTRTDDRLLYTHTYGYKQTLETLVRSSYYRYEPAAQPTPGVFTTAIDSFSEFRLRYAHPFTPEQVASVRYTARPTTLVGGESFVSQKFEGDVESQWTPRFQTTFGTGVLHDLQDTATSASDLTYQVLWKLGAQYVFNDRADASFRFITNPDLDSTIYSTTVIQAGYSFSGTYSGIARVRFDDYKTADNESSYYAGVRITPISHLWTEVGIKYVKRGPSDGFFGLVSAIWRF